MHTSYEQVTSCTGHSEASRSVRKPSFEARETHRQHTNSHCCPPTFELQNTTIDVTDAVINLQHMQASM